MAYDHVLDAVPGWAFFLLIELSTLGPLEGGYRVGARRRRRADHELEGPVGHVVGAPLALLGFMGALPLGVATARFDARKGALIEGVNAIETAYRNASLVPEPHQGATRQLLRQYVASRLGMAAVFDDPAPLQTLDARVRALQHALWAHAEALAAADRSSETDALFTASLQEVLQIHTKRLILGAHHRIPLLVWVGLLIVTIITRFGVGFQFGLVGNRSLRANVTLALTFALVTAIIFDLDQPGRGFIRVGQGPMYELHERLQARE